MWCLLSLAFEFKSFVWNWTSEWIVLDSRFFYSKIRISFWTLDVDNKISRTVREQSYFNCICVRTFWEALEAKNDDYHFQQSFFAYAMIFISVDRSLLPNGIISESSFSKHLLFIKTFLLAEVKLPLITDRLPQLPVRCLLRCRHNTSQRNEGRILSEKLYGFSLNC
jgi:hypothetical protein